MLEIKDIEKLAHLARIELPENEKEPLVHDMHSILNYIDQITSVDVSSVENELPEHRNIFREDQNTHVTGTYTKDILNLAPQNQDGFVKVKKIL